MGDIASIKGFKSGYLIDVREDSKLVKEYDRVQKYDTFLIQISDKSDKVYLLVIQAKGVKMKKVLTGTILVLMLSLVLTACGSNKTTLNVTATDKGYDSPTYTVPAGAEVTVNLTNNGAIEHEFAVLKLGEHVTPPFGDKDEAKIFWELDGVEAGKTKSDTFTAPTEPGQYDVICGIPGHIELGMTATLIVK